MRSASAVGSASSPASCAPVSARRLGMVGCPRKGVVCLLRCRPEPDQWVATHQAGRVQLGQRAALYCRVSTADQSCARQEWDLTAFAARAGYNVVSVFRETASGAKLDRAERPKVMALVQVRQMGVSQTLARGAGWAAPDPSFTLC